MLQHSGTMHAVFHALGHPARQTIVERLSGGPASIGELAEPLDMTLSAVVQHVKVLERGGVIATEKIGRVRTCRLQPNRLADAERWIARRRASWECRLDRLGTLLDGDAPPGTDEEERS